MPMLYTAVSHHPLTMHLLYTRDLKSPKSKPQHSPYPGGIFGRCEIQLKWALGILPWWAPGSISSSATFFLHHFAATGVPSLPTTTLLAWPRDCPQLVPCHLPQLPHPCFCLGPKDIEGLMPPSTASEAALAKASATATCAASSSSAEMSL